MKVSTKAKNILNSLMVLAIVILAVGAVMTVGSIQGWFGQEEPIQIVTPGGEVKTVELVAQDKLGNVNIQRSGVAYSLENGNKLRDGDIIETLNGSTIGSSKWANCLTGGRNEFTMVVTPPEGSNKKAAAYTFTVDCAPSLTDLSVRNGDDPLYLDDTFKADTLGYALTVPKDAQTVTVNAVPGSENYTVTYNGGASNTVDISSVHEIQVTVRGETAVSTTYTLTLNRAESKTVRFRVTPADAIIKVYDQKGAAVSANGDGSFCGMFAAAEYTYTITRYGYIAQSGTIPGEGGTIAATLEKAESRQEDLSSFWPDFRGNNDNMAITDIALPIEPENTYLKWAVKLGTGWSALPSVQIIVDNALIVMLGTGKLYKLDLQTGQVLASADMVAAPNWGYTPPTYAEGMIFCPLTGGKVQAFDAKTLDSLWVYTDPLKGQSLSPITYSDGYIYTGFWNGEKNNANFVALSVTDEDPSQTQEAKTATWRHTQPGGFYWAGSAVVGDAVIVGTDDGDSGFEGTGYLYSFNKYTGKVISKLSLTGDQRSSIAYDAASGKIYFTTKAGFLYSACVGSGGQITGLKGVDYNAQSTSTPVVYKGRVYFGTGSGISSTGSSGNIVVVDAETLEMVYAVGLKGYPQCSLLLSTAYEEQTGCIYIYATYNMTPGGISMIRTTADAESAEEAELIELYDAEGYAQYCIASLICGPDGTLYYKNDSGNVLAVAELPYIRATRLIRDRGEAEAVEVPIDAIGQVTPESGDAIAAARSAYEDLSADEQALVTNYEILAEAESAWKELNEPVPPVEPEDPEDPEKPGGSTSELPDPEAPADKEVAAVTEKIDRLTGDDPQAVVEAYLAYQALTDQQKVQVSNYDALEDMTTRLAAQDHRDEDLGMTIDGVDWYIRLEVTEILSGSVYDTMAGSIGSNELLKLWDIRLVDTLTGQGSDPVTSAKVAAEVPGLDPDQTLRIAYLTKEGQIRYLECTVSGETVSWDTDGSFAFALVAQSQAATDPLPEDTRPPQTQQPTQTAGDPREQGPGSMMWLWILLVVLGAGAVIAIIVLKRRSRL